LLRYKCVYSLGFKSWQRTVIVIIKIILPI